MIAFVVAAVDFVYLGCIRRAFLPVYLFLARFKRNLSDYLVSYGLNVWVLPKTHVLKS